MSDLSAAWISASAAPARSAETRRTYASAWGKFTTWCRAEGHAGLPACPATVAAYLVASAGTLASGRTRAYAPATLAHHLAAIAHHHREAGHSSPTGDDLVRQTMAGIRRDYATAGDRPRAPRAPLLANDILTIIERARATCEGWADEVLERRDAAILLLGFAGAFRRSELVSLTCGDVSLRQLDGLYIRLHRSNTDQGNRDAIRAIPFTNSHTSCPPCTWMRWVQVVATHDAGGRPAVIQLLRSAEPFEGHVCRGPRPRTAPDVPLLRAIRKNGDLSDTPLSGAAVHKTIRRRAESAGYDPEFVAKLGGHSLRAGFVTQAFRSGAAAHAIMGQTGRSTPAMLEFHT